MKFADFNIIAFVVTTRAKSPYPAKKIANARTVAVGKFDAPSATESLEIPPTILESQDAEMEEDSEETPAEKLDDKSDENERSKPEKHNASPHKEQPPAKRTIPAVCNSPPKHMTLVKNWGVATAFSSQWQKESIRSHLVKNR